MNKSSLPTKIKEFFARVSRAIRGFFVGIFAKLGNKKAKQTDETIMSGEKSKIPTKEQTMTSVDRQAVAQTDKSIRSDGNLETLTDETILSDGNLKTPIGKESLTLTDEEILLPTGERPVSVPPTVYRDDFKTRAKSLLLGSNDKKGLVEKVICYALLILFGFVYLYPILYMLAYSLMDSSDVVNPMVNYLPTSFYIDNYKEVGQALDYWDTLFQTVLVSVVPSLFQTLSTMLVAYGLARFEFRGKKIIFACIIITFVVPQQITLIPQIMLFKELSLLDSLASFIVPAALGQGIKSAVFILIFYQFFSAIPKSVEEAAKIDGANGLEIFLKIGIPAAMPAILLSFLLSVVWYYNETVLSAVYFGSELTTLPLELGKLKQSYMEMVGGGAATTGKSINEALYMAGTLLSILPLLIAYFFTQRFFVDGIDKAGITGE